MQDEPRIVDELKQMQREPLLPAEKYLIIISLLVGVLLLAAFVLVR